MLDKQAMKVVVIGRLRELITAVRTDAPLELGTKFSDGWRWQPCGLADLHELMGRIAPAERGRHPALGGVGPLDEQGEALVRLLSEKLWEADDERSEEEA
jgi:hypothetical protein